MASTTSRNSSHLVMAFTQCAARQREFGVSLNTSPRVTVSVAHLENMTTIRNLIDETASTRGSNFAGSTSMRVPGRSRLGCGCARGRGRANSVAGGFVKALQEALPRSANAAGIQCVNLRGRHGGAAHEKHPPLAGYALRRGQGVRSRDGRRLSRQGDVREFGRALQPRITPSAGGIRCPQDCEGRRPDLPQPGAHDHLEQYRRPSRLGIRPRLRRRDDLNHFPA